MPVETITPEQKTLLRSKLLKLKARLEAKLQPVQAEVPIPKEPSFLQKIGTDYLHTIVGGVTRTAKTIQKAEEFTTGLEEKALRFVERIPNLPELGTGQYIVGQLVKGAANLAIGTPSSFIDLLQAAGIYGKGGIGSPEQQQAAKDLVYGFAEAAKEAITKPGETLQKRPEIYVMLLPIAAKAVRLGVKAANPIYESLKTKVARVAEAPKPAEIPPEVTPSPEQMQVGPANLQSQLTEKEAGQWWETNKDRYIKTWSWEKPVPGQEALKIKRELGAKLEGKLPTKPEGGTTLYAGISVPVVKEIQSSINNFWAEKIGKPIAGGLDRLIHANEPVGKVYDYLFKGEEALNPQLVNIKRQRLGFLEEYKAKVNRIGELINQAMAELPADLPEKTKFARITQLLEPRTSPLAKLPTGEVPKAGITETFAETKIPKIMEEVEDLMSDIRISAVKSGLLDPETALRNEGAHLHREFVKKKIKRTGFPFKPWTIKGGEFKQRAIKFQQREKARLSREIRILESVLSKKGVRPKTEEQLTRLYTKGVYEVAREPKIPLEIQVPMMERRLKTIGLLEKASTPIAGEITQAGRAFAKTQRLQARGEILQYIGQLQKLKETVAKRIDIPLKTQIDLGLEIDPAARAVRGGAETIWDIANHQALIETFKNRAWTSTVPRENWVEQYKPSKMSASTWHKATGLTPEKPVYIRPDVHADVLDFATQRSRLAQSYQSILGFLRKLLTVRFPGFVPFNYIGNFMFVEAGGGSIMRYTDTIGKIMRNDPEIKPYTDILKRSGDLQDVTALAEIEKYLTPVREGMHPVRRAVTWIDEQLDRFPGQKYLLKLNTVIDQAVKVEQYRSALERGLTHEQALAWMRKFSVSPSLLSRGGKLLQRTGIPLFISFALQTGKVMNNMAKEKPLSLAKWLSTPYILAELSRELYGVSDDEWDRAVKNLPPFVQSWYIPKIVIGRSVDENGQPTIKILNIANLFPYTALLDLAGANYRGIGSSPVINFVFEATYGVNPQTGQDIVKPEEVYLLDKVKTWAGEFGKSFISPYYRTIDKTMDYMQGIIQKRTGQPISTEEYFINLSPFKEYTVNPTVVQYNQRILKVQIEDLRRRARQIEDAFRRGEISEETRNKTIEILENQAQKLGKKAEQLELTTPFRVAPPESIGIQE